uniref:Uncharacterized protein n=1 Tax=Ananas comosus var. bracteatus TaxID=296719 RepID=A0A6V7PYE2_ANACO|nr:unnamed protein product [Ananas comosus var. bracteatus]
MIPPISGSIGAAASSQQAAAASCCSSSSSASSSISSSSCSSAAAAAAAASSSSCGTSKQQQQLSQQQQQQCKQQQQQLQQSAAAAAASSSSSNGPIGRQLRAREGFRCVNGSFQQKCRDVRRDPASPSGMPEQTESSEVQELRAPVSALVGAGAMQRQEENIRRLQDLVSQQATTPAPGSQDAPIPDPPAIVPPPLVIIPPVVSGPSDSDSTATRAEHKQSSSSKQSASSSSKLLQQQQLSQQQHQQQQLQLAAAAVAPASSSSSLASSSSSSASSSSSSCSNQQQQLQLAAAAAFNYSSGQPAPESISNEIYGNALSSVFDFQLIKDLLSRPYFRKKDKKVGEKLVSVADIAKEHWATYGRNFFSRYDYEECEFAAANQMMEHLRDLISKSKLVEKHGATVPVYIEQFEPDVSKHDMDAQTALKPLIDIALSVAKLKDFTRREKPIVIT